MRLYEIAGGEKSSLENLMDDEKFLNTVRMNSSEVITVMKKTGKILYRGFSSETKPIIFHGKSRDKRSYYTDEHFVQFLDKALQGAGFASWRENSMPCTTDIEQASDFGNPYYILPFNGFAYNWSSKIKDFGGYFVDDPESTDILLTRYQHKPEGLVKFLGFKNKDFIKAFKLGYEIGITGEYYAIQSKTSEGQELFKRIIGQV
jgi:hypothetical protein